MGFGVPEDSSRLQLMLFDTSSYFFVFYPLCGAREQESRMTSMNSQYSLKGNKKKRQRLEIQTNLMPETIGLIVSLTML